VQPDTVHGDTHAQSAPVFALAHLLGINLMPRIRDVKDLVFYKADRRRRYKNIESLFRASIEDANRAALCRYATRRHLDQGRPHDAINDPAPPRLREREEQAVFRVSRVGVLAAL
jgi:Tn3 transposase DDE domain